MDMLLGPEKELAWQVGLKIRKGRDDGWRRGWGRHRACFSDLGERIMFIRPTAWRLWALPSTLTLGVYLPFKLEATDPLELAVPCSRS